jgi:hypothetical protein
MVKVEKFRNELKELGRIILLLATKLKNDSALDYSEYYKIIKKRISGLLNNFEYNDSSNEIRTALEFLERTIDDLNSTQMEQFAHSIINNADKVK